MLCLHYSHKFHGPHSITNKEFLPSEYFPLHGISTCSYVEVSSLRKESILCRVACALGPDKVMGDGCSRSGHVIVDHQGAQVLLLVGGALHDHTPLTSLNQAAPLLETHNQLSLHTTTKNDVHVAVPGRK